ncbi:MAG: Gfo/Idh/MocA family oxidoreductase [Deltaproteobacteria bacterium]|nr:Gfo/Idh/MocA family oxidoreductase [Deltaproteobacteria bacterium]
MAETRQPGNSRKISLGFLGVGWIGFNRLKSLVESRQVQVEAAALADPAEAATRQVLSEFPAIRRFYGLEELLAQDLDGIVIATPSALHADQAIRALAAGFPVFCQKPLARSAAETRQVLAAARKADRLLGIDLSYRHVEGMQQLREMIQVGEIGSVYAVDLVFHNAYGPDKEWYYDPASAGGGCLMDLGIHLVDLALWTLGSAEISKVTACLLAGGRPLANRRNAVEDYALAHFQMNGATVSLACSWNLPAGCEAVINASFYGTKGGLAVRNVNGSFFQFVCEVLKGTNREVLAGPSAGWWGKAAEAWAGNLAASPAYDPGVETVLAVAEVLEAIYEAACLPEDRHITGSRLKTSRHSL